MTQVIGRERFSIFAQVVGILIARRCLKLEGCLADISDNFIPKESNKSAYLELFDP